MNVSVWWSALELFVNTLECVLLLCFPICVFAKEKRGARFWVCTGIAFWVLLAAEYSYALLGVFQPLVLSVILVGYAWVAFQGNWLKKTAVGLIPELLLALVNGMSMYGFGLLFYDQPGAVFLPGYQRVLALCMSKLLYLGTVLFMVRISRKSQNLEPQQWAVVGSLFGVASFAQACLFELTGALNLGAKQQLLGLCIAISMLLVSVAFFFMVARLSKENEIKSANQLLVQAQSFQKRQITLLQENAAEVSHVKHDLKNYLLLIAQSIQSKQYAQALQDCAQVTGKLEKSPSFIQTQSYALTIVLNEKLRNAREDQVDVSCQISENLGQSVGTDFCIILANLFDNALEHCRTLGEQDRKIELQVQSVAGFLRLCLKNPIQKSVLGTNPGLLTTKKTPGNHGIGHQSVARMVAACQGEIQYSEKENIFIAEALIPLQNTIE